MPQQIPKSASPEAQRLVLAALKPDRHEHNLRIVRHFQAGNPTDAFANHLLAQTLNESGQGFEAIQFAQNAVKFSDFAPHMVSQLARLYLEFGFLENLEPLLTQALVRAPTSALLASDMGDYYAAIGRADRAEAQYRRSLELSTDPKFRNALNRALVDALRSNDRNAEARLILNEIKPTKEQRAFALTKLSDLAKGDEADALIAEITAFIGEQAPDLNASEVSRLWLALGGLLDKRGVPDQAFAAWRKAHEVGGPSYSAEKIEALVSRTKGFYTSSLFAALQMFGQPSQAPVFVIGMPRSGTTLLEQILSAHSQIASAGELGRMGRRNLPFLEMYDKPGGGDLLRGNAVRGELMARAAEHVKLATLVAGRDAPRLVDKMPTQFIAAGYIHLCFPNARFIHIARHPADTFISTYQNNFSHDYAFAFSQEAFGHFYKQYDALMAHWHNVFPNQILDVSYESLVSDPESEIRRILDFLGLAWEPNCLNFFLNASSVRTFSKDQVRSGINTNSIGRWRNYERFLAPLLGALQGKGAGFAATNPP